MVVVMGWMTTIFHTLDICFYSSRNKAEITDPNYSIPFKVAALTGSTQSSRTTFTGNSFRASLEIAFRA